MTRQDREGPAMPSNVKPNTLATDDHLGDPDAMRWIDRGTFAMGSEDFYPEERPVHRVSLDGFWIDERPVTAADYRRFVRASGYVTVAERPLDPDEYPDADPDLLVPGSLVFRKANGPVDLDDYRNWWEYLPGASWKRPGGRERRSTAATASGRPRRLRGRGGVRDLGRQGAALRGGVGVRRPRRPRRRRLRVGRRALPRRRGSREHLAGRVPLAEPEARRLRGHVPGRELSRRTATASTT